MKKANLILVLLFVLLFTLVGCKKKTDETPKDEQKQDTYTLTKEEYLSLRSDLLSPRLFLDGNFTFKISQNSSANKIADGKFDGLIEGDPTVYVFDKNTYDSTTTKVALDEYYYDTDDKIWYLSKENYELKTIYKISGLFYLELLPNSYDDLSYNEAKRVYTYSGTIDGDPYSIEFSVKNGKLIDYRVIGEASFIYEFSDYGTTTVNVPTEYVEDK